MRYDYLLLGGALQSGLLALAIRHWKPSATIAVVERDKKLGGNHTWSFHAGDVPKDSCPWFDPLVQWRWPGYDVIFPNHQRRIIQPYGAFTGSRLDQVVRANFLKAHNCTLLTDAHVVSADKNGCTLANGRLIQANAVIDSRGPEFNAIKTRSGYQKFVGLEVRLESAHRMTHPILMDTCVPQIDGMRFFYVLPFAEDCVLVEDTYFSNDPGMDADVLHERILDWITKRGWKVLEILREERGVLPMPCERRPQPLTSVCLSGGYAGGWFNPATGYSLPLAVRFARFVATNDINEIDGPALTNIIAERDRQSAFFLLLNCLLFDAASPEMRRNVMERFYKLPENCITRFYAMNLRPTDQARIFCGRPPKGIRLRNVIKTIGKWVIDRPGRSG